MINKNHPKFPEYKERFEKIREDLAKEIDEASPSYGFDGKSTEIFKKYGAKVKALQNEYSFLYPEGNK